MTWQNELNDIADRQAIAQQMGGEEKVARHKAAGKLTVRERIDAIADPGSFQEIGSITGFTRYDENGALASYVPSNLIMGRALVDGRPVVLVGDDFTIRGGANDGAITEKLAHAERMSHDLELPMIRLVDGTGGGGSVKNIETKGHTLLPMMREWQLVAENLARVPVVGLALGSVAGKGAARVAASHYSMMVRGTSQLFNAGPPVVARIGQKLEKNELGGSHIHTRNGVVDDEVGSEAEAFARARRFLSYLPRSVFELAPRAACTDDPGRRDETLLDAIPRDPRKVYKIRPILESVMDAGSFFEIGRHWGKGIVTGLARLDGWPVAVLASEPYHYGGIWDKNTTEKFTRFVDLAQTFHLPVVNFVDVPGFQIGIEAEQSGVMRAGVRALSAVYQTTTPWCTMILRKAYGVAAAGHQHQGRYALRYAWPSANWGSLPIEGGLEAAYKSELLAAEDPAAKLQEIEARLRQFASPVRSAEAFVIEEIIDPRDTRRILCDFANLVAPLRKAGLTHFRYRP
ncbi:acyl-CoA carboxylase subunit beta [Bordetella genomosp. 7]|uniref:Methylmalonyl-CoA carboxyltransferase n=1 Tax=Bordetella genomosp. 7 TaxID=1416805 RepID=A0A261QX84_9BORD|nr:carboxyl transferase domain-containing protein [Bordetella genomosp. 7]OZI17147.1 methylmalonyl-CoA carboxyltransferase [Bordetella genomosp. 7]